jgi:hypothetical protein
MDEREFASEQEFFDGVRADGAKPVLHSRKLYNGATKPFSDQPTNFPFENRDPRTVTADELLYEVKLQELEDANLALETARELIDIGRAAARRAPGSPAGRESGSQTPEASREPADTSTGDAEATPAAAGSEPPQADIDASRDDPETGPGLGCNPDLRFRTPGLRSVGPGNEIGLPELPFKTGGDKPKIDRVGPLLGALDRPARKRRPVDPDVIASIKPEAGLVMAERGCRLLLAASPVRAAIARELIAMAMELETKQSFLWDRAHGLVCGTLLHMDEHWEEMGFGSWMPFRYPDQWLSFCGIMTRILAANGLIHAKHADVYRRLLDETPPVELKGTIDDRIKESRTPHNMARCKINQGAYTMSELKTRLQNEVWDRQDEREERQKHLQAQFFKPPPG